MRSSIRIVVAAAIVAALLAAVPAAFAQKKPGGSPPPGIIYFKHDGTVWKMNSDGSGRAPVSGAPQKIDNHAHPTFQRHGGAHWFTNRDTPIPSLFFPNLHQYVEIWTVSAETGNSVPLVAESDLNVLSQGVWLPDD